MVWQGGGNLGLARISLEPQSSPIGEEDTHGSFPFGEERGRRERMEALKGKGKAKVEQSSAPWPKKEKGPAIPVGFGNL